MNGKSFFVDLTRCTACRGCQIACKQWKKLPAEPTRNMGSHQNPQDLSFNTYKLVRFQEQVINKQVHWLFFPDQCRHCVEPPCKMASENPDSILHDPETGAVVFTAGTAKESLDVVKGACPYDIPRQDEKSKVMAKCDMCIDRVKAGLLPACVKTCPTGAMNFGDRDAMLTMAKERLAAVKKKYPKAMLINPDDVRVIVLTAYAPELYAKNLMADAGQPVRLASRRELLASLLRPVRSMASG